MNWWRRLWNRKKMDQQLDKELRFHLEEQTADLIAQGLSPEKARREAQIAFGGPTRIFEECRDTRGTRWLEDLVQDLRYAFHTLRQRPGFAVVSILTLTLGIGSTTAIFSAVNPILFQSLPYPDAHRIMMLWEMRSDGRQQQPAFATYFGEAEHTQTFDAIAALKPWQPTMTGPDQPERLEGQSVTAAYFHVLGIAPLLGRDFLPSEDTPKAPKVTILSNGLWRRRFGGDYGIAGRQIKLDDNAYTVIGVMPPGFENVLAPAAELWSPLQYDMTQGRAWGHHLRMIGKLRPGVSQEQGRRELDVTMHSLGQLYAVGYQTSGGPPKGMIVKPLQEDLTEGVRPALFAIMAAVSLVLLIACVNVTNVLLARSAQRRGEFAMRAALGAARQRLVRQLISESLLIASISAVLGLLAARFGIRILIVLSPSELPRVSAISMDIATFTFAVGLTFLVGLLVGLVPALQASRNALYTGIHENSYRASSGHHRTRRTLVVTEVALALVLLVNAGLLLRSFQRLFAVAPGFDATNLLTMQVQTSGRRFDDNKATLHFFSQALDAVRQVPGVMQAGFTSQLPLSGDFEVYGGKLETGQTTAVKEFGALRYAVSPRYCETMKIPLLRGRFFDDRDTAAAPPVALVGDSFVRHEFAGQDPLGKRIQFGPGEDSYTIVGVIGDVKQTSLALSQLDAVYIPTAQWHWADGVLSLVVRSRRNPTALVGPIRKAIWSVDKDQPIVRVATMNSLLAASEAERHFALVIFEALALAALALAAVGIYGVLAGSVTERIREIGVRSALGASRSNILALVLRQGMTLAVVGVLIGAVGAMLTSQTLVSLLFGVSRLDPVTYLGVIVLLMAVSAFACWAPAWRAARVDPSITLRAE